LHLVKYTTYIGILLEAHPILHISRIRVKEEDRPKVSEDRVLRKIDRHRGRK
jgi:hypothetical protein